MNSDLKKIKKLYGENMMHLCRNLFPTILEVPGLLVKLMTDTFEPSRLIYDSVLYNSLFFQRNDFEEYIVNLTKTEEEREEKSKEVELSVRELLSMAGYDFFECTTESQIQSFRKYYQKGEELCTFWTKRLNHCHVFFAVKKNVDEIKRENFTKPARQDEYGTSVISIQFSKGNNTLSIKNRYNHTVANPDATFSNNLENIIPGLTDAFRREYGFSLNKKLGVELDLPKCVKVGSKFYGYNYEIDNIYYCPNNVVIDNFQVKRYEKEKYIVMDYFILDLDNKKMSVNPNSPIALKDSFIDEFNDIDKINIINRKGGNKEIRITTKTNHEIIIGLDEHSRIIFYHNPRVVEIKDNFLTKNIALKRLSLPNLKKIGNDFGYSFGHEDIRLFLPSLEEVGNDFLSGDTVIQELKLPKLRKVGNWFLSNNREVKELSLPSLEEVGNYFMKCSFIQELSLPKLRKTGCSFCYRNSSLRVLMLPSLEEVGYDFLCDNKCLETIFMPKLKKAGECFLFSNKKLKSILLQSLEEVGDKFLHANEELEEVSLPKLKKAGNCFLRSNKKLVLLSLPLLEEMGEYFMGQNNSLTSLSVPKLRKIKPRFLVKNSVLSYLDISSVEKLPKTFLSACENIRKIKADNLPEPTKEELFKRLCIEENQVEKNEPNLSASKELHEVPITKVEQSSKKLGTTINETIKNGAEIAASQSMEPLELEGVTRR